MRWAVRARIVSGLGPRGLGGGSRRTRGGPPGARSGCPCVSGGEAGGGKTVRRAGQAVSGAGSAGQTVSGARRLTAVRRRRRERRRPAGRRGVRRRLRRARPTWVTSTIEMMDPQPVRQANADSSRAAWRGWFPAEWVEGRGHRVSGRHGHRRRRPAAGRGCPVWDSGQPGHCRAKRGESNIHPNQLKFSSAWSDLLS